MNIYTKLREAVKRSTAVNNLVMADKLLAELKKLEEEDDTNRRAFAKEFDKKLKEEVLPPLTKEEKMSDAEAIEYVLASTNAILDPDDTERVVNAILLWSDKFKAEARKKALEEVRAEMKSCKESSYGLGWMWSTLERWINNKLDEMMKR